MSCDAIYEPRIRFTNDVVPAQTADATHIWWNRNLITDPINPCSLGKDNPSVSHTVTVPAMGYVSSIEDEVLTSEAKAKANYPRICFKNLHHTFTRGELLGKLSDKHIYDPILYPTSTMKYCFWYESVKCVDDSFGEYYSPASLISNKVGVTFDAHDVSTADLHNAFARLEPTIENEVGHVSVPNFLLELGDIRRLGDLFSTKYRDIAAATGDKFLGVNFGALPIIRDIQEMMTLAQRIKDYINRWNELADKKAVITFKATIFDFRVDEVIPPSLEDGTLTPTYEATITGNYRDVAKLHIYALPKRLPLGTADEAILNAYGFHNPAAVIWEAIPFSFVVDWFTNVGQLFDDDDKKLLLYEIVDGGYSQKTEVKARADGIQLSPLGASSNLTYPSFQTVPFLETTVDYKRTRLTPGWFNHLRIFNPGWVLETSTLSPFQTLLGAALTHH